MQEVGGLVAWEKKGGSDGQVGERKGKKRKRKERKKENGLLHWASVWATKMEVGSGP